MTVIDLHCHTTASDGTLSPQDLVARALRDGVDVIAVTDHDTTDGIDEAVAAGDELGVRVVPGIELSARTSERNVHVLGYFIDPTSLELRATLDRAPRVTARRARTGSSSDWASSATRSRSPTSRRRPAPAA